MVINVNNSIKSKNIKYDRLLTILFIIIIYDNENSVIRCTHPTVICDISIFLTLGKE